MNSIGWSQGGDVRGIRGGTVPATKSREVTLLMIQRLISFIPLAVAMKAINADDSPSVQERWN